MNGQMTGSANVGVNGNGLSQNANAVNSWRMVNQSGQWWYWTPNNTWMYYNGNQWSPYSQTPVGAGPATTNLPNQ